MNSPKWVRVYLAITGLMALLFSTLGYLQPQLQFGTWEAIGAVGATSLAGPLGVYLARNVATVVVSGFAAMDATTSALRAALLLRACTDGLDAVHNILANNMPAVGFAAVMFAVDVGALVAVGKKSL